MYGSVKIRINHFLNVSQKGTIRALYVQACYSSLISLCQMKHQIHSYENHHFPF